MSDVESTDMWSAFVTAGGPAARALEEGVTRLVAVSMSTAELRAYLGELAYHAFSIACQSLLLGAEDLGALALTCERCLDYLASGAIAMADVVPILAQSAFTLRRAIDELGQPHGLSTGPSDRSGARTSKLPLSAARYELETFFPVPGKPIPRAAAAPDVPLTALTRGRLGAGVGAGVGAGPGAGVGIGVGTGAAALAPLASAAALGSDAADAPSDRHTGSDTAEPGAWQPRVAEDMVELFFEEARERIEDLALKLLDVEQRPGDAELLRAVFRDLHTLKGSSAMVGLAPMNTLAHAAEDLVGQVQSGVLKVDGAVIDALLAALDGLRDIVALARSRQPIGVNLTPILRKLRDPHAEQAAEGDGHGQAETPATPATTLAERPEPGPGPGPGSGPTAAPSRQTIRVDFDKLDRLMNLVGELVLGRDGLRNALGSLSSLGVELSSDRRLTRRLTSGRHATTLGVDPGTLRVDSTKVRDVLQQLNDELGRVERVLGETSQDLDQAIGRLDSVSSELRDQVMKLRMIPVGGVFRKHHRTVRDLAAALGKRVKLELHGEDTELDKLMVETLDEPLVHLIRNAVDHGIEPPDIRQKAGKSAEGTIRLSASHRGNQMVIQVADDGRGIDPEALRRRARERGLLGDEELGELDDQQILDVIFRPGFSTAATVSQVSGRGVGMDVVRQIVVSRLKGTIDIESQKGAGTRFTLKLPLTLAIIQVLLARAGGELLAIPLDPVVRTVAYPPDQIQLIQDREVIEVRGRQVPLIRLASVLELELPQAMYGDTPLQVVLIEVMGELYGLACDHLLGKREIVIKPLGALLANVPCAAGATILRDRCALILDVPAVVQRALRMGGPWTLPPPGPSRRAPEPAAATAALHVLVVEDSDVIREVLRRLFTDAGFACTVAADGVDGLRAATERSFDAVTTDVMMPRMDGYELTRALRAMPAYRDTPIVMITSRGERIDRVRGFDAGVDEYITKPHDRQFVLRAVRKLLSERQRPESSDKGPDRNNVSDSGGQP